MLHATVGVLRALLRRGLDPHRRPHLATTLHRRSLAAARILRSHLARLTSTLVVRAAPTAPRTRARFGAHPRTILDRLAPRRLASGRTRAIGHARATLHVAGERFMALVASAVRHERALPVGMAGLLLVAALLSTAPATIGHAGTGAVSGPGQTPRIAIGGGAGSDGTGANGAGGDVLGDIGPAGAATGPIGAVDGAGTTPSLSAGQQRMLAANGPDPSAQVPQGPYLVDGTLLKPVAVDTSVADGRDQLRAYTVQSGDTLTGIASRFGVSMMTIWWANNLASKDQLHVGQKLVVPPVNGLVVTVKDGDTLDAIAGRTGVDKKAIVAFNGLTDEHLVIGQTLIIPGAQGAAIPDPTPAPRSESRVSSGSSGGGSVRPPASYGGGRFAWPVPGGYISQYFHWGHPAIDIAADYGNPVLSAAPGTVVFAGWRNNGGGWQVWVAHGSDVYTTYNHMSAITVGYGEHIGRGEQVGRIGMSGSATGPHCHFEVWRGFPWDGGSYRVNPLDWL